MGLEIVYVFLVGVVVVDEIGLCVCFGFLFYELVLGCYVESGFV